MAYINIENYTLRFRKWRIVTERERLYIEAQNTVGDIETGDSVFGRSRLV